MKESERYFRSYLRTCRRCHNNFKTYAKQGKFCLECYSKKDNNPHYKRLRGWKAVTEFKKRILEELSNGKVQR